MSWRRHNRVCNYTARPYFDNDDKAAPNGLLSDGFILK